MKKTVPIFLSFLVLLSTVFFPLTASAATFNIGFNTTSKSVMLINLDTDTTVYEKNIDDKRSIASLTKIMTYIVTVENVPDLEGTKVTINKDVIDSLLGTGSSLANLKAGDVLSIKQLLYGMMIPSGNDAALCLAHYVGKGDINKFVDMMNKKATDLGCKNTHFTNPHGLYDPNHYSSARDLYIISEHALALPLFSEITNTTTSYIFGEDRPPLVTTNSMIDSVRGGQYYYRYAKGIKTGHFTEAGYCLVSTAIKNGYTYMCIALGSPSVDESGNKITKNGAMIDSRELYKWAFSSLRIKNVLDSDEPINEVSVKLAWNKDKTLLVPAKNYSTILPNGVEVSSIEIEANTPNEIYAPIKAGEKIGTATLKYANQKLATIDLVASENIKRNNFLYVLYVIKKIFTSPWFIFILCILVALLVAYIWLMMKHNTVNRKNRIKRFK